MREDEGERIKKEFRLNRYSERFNVKFDVIIKALFGDRDKSKYLNNNPILANAKNVAS
jgi:hypothetical protein